MTPFQQYVRLVDSPENQALPEAERLPMVAGWDRVGGRWIRPYTCNHHTCYDVEDVCMYDDFHDQFQAASGVLAEWLGDDECAIIGQHRGRWYVCHTKLKSSVYGPTMLAAQVAAAGAVLGVKA